MTRELQLAAARRFANAERSDPFAFARAVAHIDNGITGNNSVGDFVCYDATETTETRYLERTGEFKIAAYREIKRP